MATDTVGTEKQIQVMELFGPTIQGEGLMTGTLTHFLRVGGCSLRCSWCDSLFSVLPEQIKKHRTLMTPSETLDAIYRLPWAPYVTLTGGDPAIQERLGDIVKALNGNGMKVAVETQGMFFPNWFADVDVLTFSPKGPSSGNIVEIDPLAEYLTSLPVNKPQRVCIKVVVFNKADFDYAMRVYKGIPERYYDAFYFTAGTPPYPEFEGSDDSPYRIAMSQQRILDVVHNEQEVTKLLLEESKITRFSHKAHVGCQQHVLLWPDKEKGV